jgi:type VI secretion system secreted protein VgrG
MLVEGGKPNGTPAADDKGVARYDEKYGIDRAQRSLDAIRQGKRGIDYETNCMDLAPGTVFGIDLHPHPELALRKHVLATSLSLDFTEGEGWKMKGAAVFAAERFRPQMKTPKPQVLGVQSATVVGPKPKDDIHRGDEIHTDEFGRVRVQFPWDREGQSDDGSSCWIRVSQGWAGTGFGMINLPRIGQEVLVGFLGGDPDEPIVVGRVFNALEPVPYKLPENKTVSGWRTNSSPGGGGYNEIKFDDQKNGEHMYIQAERNLDKLVKKDETERVEGDHYRKVVGHQNLFVVGNKIELNNENTDLLVRGGRREDVEGSQELWVAGDHTEKFSSNFTSNCDHDMHVYAGVNLVLEAGNAIVLKVGGTHITLTKDHIYVEGTETHINCDKPCNLSATRIENSTWPQFSLPVIQPKDSSH